MVAGQIVVAMLAVVVPSAKSVEVSSAVVGRAFFDAGSERGFVVGRRVRVRRRRRTVATCVLDRASRRHSSCVTQGVLPGDRARALGRRPRPAPPPPPPEDVGPGRAEVDVRLQRAARARLDRRAFTLVEHRPIAGPVRALRAEIALGHDAFVRAEASDTHRERVDATLRDLDLGFAATRAHVDLTVIGYSARPERIRFRLAEPPRLFVYETALESRPRGRAWVASVGRIRPHHAPGIPYLDGVQVGLQLADDQVEIGVLAGGLPDALTLEPSPERWAVGLYGAAQLVSDDVWSRVRVRGGAASSPETGVRGELEGGLRLGWGGVMDAAAEARVVSSDGGVELASARVSAGARPLNGLELDASFRVRNPQLDLAAPLAALVGAEHASGAVRVEVAPSIKVSAVGGYGRFFEQGYGRGWVGPEVDFTRLFGDVGGLGLGHQEAFGDLPGRSSWVQTILRPLSQLRLQARVSWFEDRVEGSALRDLGAYLHAEWRIIDALRVRGSLLGRLPFEDAGDGRPTHGLLGRLTLVGTL